MPSQVFEQLPERVALDETELVEGERQVRVSLAAGLVLEDGQAAAVLQLARERVEKVLEGDVGRLGAPQIAQADRGVGRIAGHAEDSPSAGPPVEGEIG